MTTACEAPAAPNVERARTRVGLALSLVELAGQVLAELPGPDLAFRHGDPELFRYLQAAETMTAWLVGPGPGDSLDCPGPESALGDGIRIFEWGAEEAERHFQSACREWSERQ